MGRPSINANGNVPCHDDGSTGLRVHTVRRRRLLEEQQRCQHLDAQRLSREELEAFGESTWRGEALGASARDAYK